MTTTSIERIHRYVCGVCFDLRDAHFEPTACFCCGAIFERGAPIALARLVFPVDRDPRIASEQRVDFVGRWPIEHRSLAMLRLAVGQDDDATVGAVDRG